MSSTASIASTAPADSDVQPLPAGFRSRGLTALYSVLLLSLVGRLVFTAWEPPLDSVARFDAIRELGGAYWPMHLYLGGPAYLLTFVTTAAFVVLLARGRTAVVNLAAAALVLLGGTLFSLAITAEALPFAYAADPGVLPEAQGRALVEVLDGRVDWLEPAIVGGMVAVTLGWLLTFVAGWISHALPRWFATVGVAYVVVFVVLPPGLLPRPVELGLYVVELAVHATLGWFGLRAVRRRPRATAC